MLVTLTPTSSTDLDQDFAYFTVDYGDAPDTFGTYNSSSGPSHVILPGLTLGDGVTSDLNGQPTTAADGDGSSDDGVVISGFLQPNQSTVMSVTVTNNTDQAAYVYGYLDLNGDGDWSDAGEMAMITVPANSGTQTVAMPFNAITTSSNQLYGRFRLSTDQTAVSSPTGFAPNGEVEDYIFTIQPTAISLTQNSATATNVVSLIALFSLATVGTLGVMARRRQEG